MELPEPRMHNAMPPLPVTHSVLAPDGIAALIDARYDLTPVTSCTLLRSYANEVYAVQTRDGEGFVFKLFRREWRNTANVQWKADLQHHLIACGCPVSEPVAQRDGKVVIEIPAPEGTRAALLLRELAGHKPARPFTDGLYFRHGTSLATLHAAMDTMPMGGNGSKRVYGAETLLDRPLDAIRRACGTSSSTSTEAARIAHELHDALDRGSSAANWGICHGDTTMDNIHVLPDGRHAFFDFDLAGYCWRALDLCAIHQWAQNDPDARSFWPAFLAGYRSQRSFGEADIALLPVIAAAWELWDIGHELENWVRWSGSWRMTPAMLDDRIARLATWNSS